MVYLQKSDTSIEVQDQGGPPNNQGGPPNNQSGPLNNQGGPPNNQGGPPNNLIPRSKWLRCGYSRQAGSP